MNFILRYILYPKHGWTLAIGLALLSVLLIRILNYQSLRETHQKIQSLLEKREYLALLSQKNLPAKREVKNQVWQVVQSVDPKDFDRIVILSDE